MPAACSIIEDFSLKPRLNNDRGTAILVAGETPVGRCAAKQAVLSEHDYLRTYANGQWSDNLLALPHMQKGCRHED